MIFIILFIGLLLCLFCHFYGVSTREDCRKRTKNGVTYTDCFGQLRLLRNDRPVKHEIRGGENNLYYLSGGIVERSSINEDMAIFKGEKDYVYERRHQINIYKNIETGEMYSKAIFNGRLYIIDYREDAPMRVLREDDCSKDTTKYRKIDIDEMNIVFEEMFEQKRFIWGDYFRYAWWRYRSLKWWVGNDFLADSEIKWQKVITRENIKTLVANPNDKWRG